MRYQTAKAFRTALETRINQATQSQGDSGRTRVRKAVVFDRLLARLMAVAPDHWIVKGGFALDLRLGDRARVTKDLDLAHRDKGAAAFRDFSDAAAMDLKGFFTFLIQRSRPIEQDQEEVAFRYVIEAQLDRRRFERVVVDIGLSAPLIGAPNYLTTSPFLNFAAIPPVTVPALPLEQHLAEKLHAYCRVFGPDRTNTRAKDLIDIVLLCSLTPLSAQNLRQAIRTTFEVRAIQAVPSSLPMPPPEWVTPYGIMATATKLNPDLMDGFEDAGNFLNPVLNGSISDTLDWDPVRAAWIARTSAT